MTHVPEVTPPPSQTQPTRTFLPNYLFFKKKKQNKKTENKNKTTTNWQANT